MSNHLKDKTKLYCYDQQGRIADVGPTFSLDRHFLLLGIPSFSRKLSDKRQSWVPELLEWKVGQE